MKRDNKMPARKLFQAMTVVSLILATSPSSAAGLNILGFDDMSCAAWIKSKADPDLRATYVNWVRGFLSGHNYALPNQQVSTISSATIEVHLDEYCASNSKSSYSEGAMRLSDKLSGRNQPIRK
jgi:hypothetical protein